MRTLASTVAVLVSLLAVVPPAHAQTAHSAPQSALDEAVLRHVDRTASDRDTVLRLLDRPDVQAVAGEAGLDLRRAKDRVATLDGQDAAGLAAHARQVEEALVGGQSRVTISTTAIIIGLLILILVIVAVN